MTKAFQPEQSFCDHAVRWRAHPLNRESVFGFAMAKRVTMAAPGMTEVLFENSRVRVIELKMKKGEKVPEHTHGTYFAYSITPFDYKSTSGGKTKTRRMKKGQLDWSDGETHAVEALMTGRALVVELK